QDTAAAGDSVRPTGVGTELGGHDGQAVARVDAGPLDRGAHRRLARDVPDGGPHVVATAQQLRDAPTAEETRPPGNEDRCAPVTHDLRIIADAGPYMRGPARPP